MKPAVCIIAMVALSAADQCHHHPEKTTGRFGRRDSEASIHTKKANEVLKSIRDDLSQVPHPTPTQSPTPGLIPPNLP